MKHPAAIGTLVRTHRKTLFSLAGTLPALLLAMPGMAHAQDASPPAAPAGPNAQALEAVTVTGNWLGSGLQNSVKAFPGARTQVDREQIESSGASTIGDVMRRIPGVQSTDNSGTAGSSISLNIGVRGLTGRYSPRSTVLLDGIPLAVAPYGQPQLSFAPVSLANIETIDVVRGAGAVRYGPQNVGGIINFKTLAIPDAVGLTGNATVRGNDFSRGGANQQYSTFIGTNTESGLGLALLYSGQAGEQWRDASGDRVNDLALKARYTINDSSEVYGKISYFDVESRTPGGLTIAQYEANPFQNTRPTDYWSGDRRGIDLGYINTISDTQEFEIRTFYNDSSRKSVLINAAQTQLTNQPRNYGVFGVEPRYTHRLVLGPTTNDFTFGYRYLRESGDDNSFTQTLSNGAFSATTSFENETTAHAFYIDDRIAIGNWRVTPGLRYERIESDRTEVATGQVISTRNNKPLPSLNVAYLLNSAATLFANYGTSFGPVQNIQLNSQTPANPLNPEVAKTIELGGRWNDQQVRAELTVFQIRFDNQIQQVPLSSPAVFQNIGATHHKGVETALSYTFDKASALKGLELYLTYTYTEAIQKSGTTAGLDVPFYSRNTDTIGAQYKLPQVAFNLNTTHQSHQYADNANTVAENAAATNGEIPGFRLWNASVSWDALKNLELQAGFNNLFDKRYYTRNVDGNPGRMVGAPRTAFVQAKLGF